MRIPPFHLVGREFLTEARRARRWGLRCRGAFARRAWDGMEGEFLTEAPASSWGFGREVKRSKRFWSADGGRGVLVLGLRFLFHHSAAAAHAVTIGSQGFFRGFLWSGCDSHQFNFPGASILGFLGLLFYPNRKEVHTNFEGSAHSGFHQSGQICIPAFFGPGAFVFGSGFLCGCESKREISAVPERAIPEKRG